MLLTKTVKISPRGKGIKIYKDLGYEFNYGDEINVKIEDLSKDSHTTIECSCDYCGEKMEMEYRRYIKQITEIIPKNCCNKCKGLKIKESNLIVYGVDSVSQLPEIQEKLKETNLKKYGCKNYTQTHEYREKYTKTCLEKYGVANVSQADEIKEKKAQTTYEHYGVINPFISKEIQEKIKKNRIYKHGMESPMKSPEVRKHQQETMMLKYGVSNPSQVEKFKEKRKATMLEKYGVENPQQSKEIKEKTKRTNLQMYGYDNPAQCPEIQAKIRETNIKKYGVPSPMQSPIIQAKVMDTMSKNNSVRTSIQQKYLCNLFNGQLNQSINKYSVDILFSNEKIALEYDGGGHFLSVELGCRTLKEFQQREIIRDKTIKQQGYKIMRIISKTDKLPSDEILLLMLSAAQTYFTTTEHTWIEYDIDNQTVRNALNKEGVFFDYGELRTIKKEGVNK